MGNEFDAARGIDHRGTASRGTSKKAVPKRRVQSVTVLVDQGLAVLQLEDRTTRSLKLTYNGRPAPGTYRMIRVSDGDEKPGAGFHSDKPTGGVANASGFVVAWDHPGDVTFAGVKHYTLTVLSGAAGPPVRGDRPGQLGTVGGSETKGEDTSRATGAPKESERGVEGGSARDSEGARGTGGASRGTGGDGARGARGTANGAHGSGDGTRATGDKQVTRAGKRGGQGRGAESETGLPQEEQYDSNLLVTDGPVRLSPHDEQLWRMLASFMAGKGQAPLPPPDLVRLFRIILQYTDRPVFGEGGEDWIRFARLLEANRDRIEGQFHGSKKGGFTTKDVESVLHQYRRFVATAPTEQSEDTTTDKPIEEELRYDPGWAALPEADRKLLLDFARRTGSKGGTGQIDFTRLTVSHKLAMALQLSWKSWPREIWEQAFHAFTDPTFLLTFVVISAIFVASWVSPDPYTKLVAAGLSAILLINFMLEDVVGFFVAVNRLFGDCTRAKTIQEVEAAGDRFAKKVGQEGFDLILFLVTWRIGKHVEPKLRQYGARRAVHRAEKAATEAQQRAAARDERLDTLGTNKVLAEAKAQLPDSAGPTEILNELATCLPGDAQNGLAAFRSKLGDRGALKSLEGQVAQGKDIIHFLSVKGIPAAELRAQERAELEAETRLGRAQAFEQGALSDKQLRGAILREQITRILSWFEDKGVLAKLASLIKAKFGLDKVAPDRIPALLAESISIVELESLYPRSQGYEVLSNLQLVREVPGYQTIAQWQAANPGKNFGGLRESNGKVWQLITDVDTVVVRKAQGGKLEIVEIEQVKSGKNDTHGDAAKQLQKTMVALKEIAAGRSDVAAFRSDGRSALSQNLTPLLDPASFSSVKASTRGPAGKKPPFDRDLYGMSVVILEAVSAALLERPLAPKKASTVRPHVSPERDNETR